MSAPNNQAFTIQTALEFNLGSRIVIGNNEVKNPSKTYNDNVYWMIIVDRDDLTVKENFVFTDNTNVPKQLAPYIGNHEYFFVLTTQILPSSNLPQGDFYKFLLSEGAGVGLKRGEQIFETLNCGNWGWFGYTYVAILGDNSTPGYESFIYQGAANIMTLELMPTLVDNKYIYSPVTIH